MNISFKIGLSTLSLLAGLALAGCAQMTEPLSANNDAVELPQSSPPSRTFDSPGDAIKALLTAAQAKDKAAVHDLFGPDVDQLLSGDATQDSVEFENFSKELALTCNPVNIDENKVVLYIGAQNWPFPIPLVKAEGKWFFDTTAGKQEVLNRRIGKDELTAIGVCRTYVTTQHEYASQDQDGSGVLKYAQRLNSNPGSHDGLYWEPVEGEDLSPLGPLIASAHEEGYDGDKPVGRTEPFHGYLFKILKEQGPDASGGKYNYVINGNMVAGFALVAYPAHWGDSGIMTFIVNQQGKVYQCNLGEKSAELAAAMTVFNPDRLWTVVEGDGLPVP